MEPLVSVILPVYNSEKYLTKVLQSIDNQTYSNYEVIIINDGSIDNSEQLIKEFIKDKSSFHYYRKKNEGPSECRNYGIKRAKGDYIVFVDSDDTIENEYIEKLTTSAIGLNLDIVTCGYKEFSRYGITIQNDFWEGNYITSKKEFLSKLFNGLGGTLWGKIFKREIIVREQLFLNSNIKVSEDLIFILKYAFHCKSFGTLEDTLYNYNRLNENSITSNMNFNNYLNLIEVNKIIERNLHHFSYSNDEIIKLLSRRIQDLVFSFVIYQHKEKDNWRIKSKNIDYVLSEVNFKKYKHRFGTEILLEKPMLRFFLKENRGLLTIYSYVLFKYYYLKVLIVTKMRKSQIDQSKALFEGDIS